MSNNDLISRTELIQRIDKYVEANYVVTDPLMTIHDIKALISILPTVDAAPVVKCKNCKYWEADQAPLDEIVDNHSCQYYNVWRAPDDYCSCGEAIDDTPTCGPDYCEIGGGDDAR